MSGVGRGGVRPSAAGGLLRAARRAGPQVVGAGALLPRAAGSRCPSPLLSLTVSHALVGP